MCNAPASAGVCDASGLMTTALAIEVAAAATFVTSDFTSLEAAKGRT